MDACLRKFSVARFSRTSASGVPRIAEKNQLAIYNNSDLIEKTMKRRKGAKER